MTNGNCILYKHKIHILLRLCLITFLCKHKGKGLVDYQRREQLCEDLCDYCIRAMNCDVLYLRFLTSLILRSFESNCGLGCDSNLFT